MNTPGDHPTAPMRSALGIIGGEHDSLAAVLRVLRQYVASLSEHKLRPDCDALAMVLSYIETFADTFHHPKEDEYLFLALRRHTRDADAILLDLQHEHATGPGELEALKRSLMRTRGGGPSDVADFAHELDRYATGQELHLRKENELVIPLARRMLTFSDWENVDRAFRAHRDPFFGVGAMGPIGGLLSHAIASRKAGPDGEVR